MAKTVLIAEDSSVIQNLTRKILEFQDFKILSAKNGQDVLFGKQMLQRNCREYRHRMEQDPQPYPERP